MNLREVAQRYVKAIEEAEAAAAELTQVQHILQLARADEWNWADEFQKAVLYETGEELPHREYLKVVAKLIVEEAGVLAVGR